MLLECLFYMFYNMFGVSIYLSTFSYSFKIAKSQDVVNVFLLPIHQFTFEHEYLTMVLLYSFALINVIHSSFSCPPKI